MKESTLAEKVAPEKEYTEVCAQIKTTDEISFRILGLVPLVSAGSILGLFLESKVVRSPTIVLVSLFAALVTFGFFRWELRNAQTCLSLRMRATELSGTAHPAAPGGWGKTEAECLILRSRTREGRADLRTTWRW